MTESKMQKVLEDGTCRAAATVYFEDMFVDFNSSMKVAQGEGHWKSAKFGSLMNINTQDFGMMV